MRKFSGILLLLFSFYLHSQTVPYNQTPDWESNPNEQIATGLGIADINNDGWKDLIVANGNDMQRQSLAVYYNNGDGTFPFDPDWESSDVDYHGHLATGDINNDGFIDVAVSVFLGEDGFSSPGKVKVYYNNNGTLESSPSFISNKMYTFSCALGDADGDGDLDLAVTCGELYNEIEDYGRIFYNNNGSFDTLNVWISESTMIGMDTEFYDFDGNGFMDVAFGCAGTPNLIFLAGNQGIITGITSWESSDNTIYTNSIDIGLIDNNEYADLVLTNNNQLGGDGKSRIYGFTDNIPATSPSTWSSDSSHYASGILLYDVNNDGMADMIYGGWWDPVRIAFGNGSDFDMPPSYTSATNSVVEAILAADLGRESVTTYTDTILVELDEVSVIYVDRQIVGNFLSVKKNGNIINDVDYCFVPGKSWISLKENAVMDDILIIEYEYSDECDLVITNWDSNKGNYIFYNTGISSLISNHSGSDITIFPNPSPGIINILSNMKIAEETKIQIINTDGQILSSQKLNSGKNTILNLSVYPPGIYFLRIINKNIIKMEKIILF